MTTKKGFTLFELLVSISIMGILVAMISISFSAAQKKGRDARRIEDMKMVQNAAEQYYSMSTYNYPTTYTTDTVWAVSGTGQTVLSAFPRDPKNSAPYTYGCSTGAATGYCCCAAMENNSGNSTNNTCTFVGVGGTGSFYCVKNQQ